MRLKRPFYCILYCLLLAPTLTVCGSDTLSIAPSDSLKYHRPNFFSRVLAIRKDTLKTRPKLTYTLNWDARSSFVDKQLVNIWGVNTGISFGKNRNELTVGYYWLTFNSFLRLIDLRKNASQLINLGYYTKTDLYYFNLMYWPNIIENQRWRFSIPVELGIGATQSTTNRLLNDLFIWRRNDFFMPAQIGIYAKWKATRWVGLSVQGGYRYAIYQQNIPTNYNGAYYSVGFTLERALFLDTYRLTKDAIKKRRARQGKSTPEAL